MSEKQHTQAHFMTETSVQIKRFRSYNARTKLNSAPEALPVSVFFNYANIRTTYNQTTIFQLN